MATACMGLTSRHEQVRQLILVPEECTNLKYEAVS